VVLSDSDIFIGKQPIFDKNNQVVAYELLFRGGVKHNSASFECEDQATETVIHNALLGFGLDELVGSNKAFINFPESFFCAGVDPVFSADSVVVELLETVRPTDEVIAALQELKDQGFQIALDDFVFKKEFIPFLKLADIIKLEVMNLSVEKVPLLFSKIRNVTNAKLLAEKVETKELHQACLEAGCELFQGYYYAKPEIVEGKKVSVARINLLDLLYQINNPNIALEELQAIIERDVGLTHKLLRMAKAYRTRSMPEFNTIREVLTLFGLKRVQSWTTMLSLATIDEVVPEVFVTALSRAIFMRNIALKEGLLSSESFYLAGMFSLLDVIMGQPLDNVLQQLPISQLIIDGLLERNGDYGRLIELAESYEKGQPDIEDAELGQMYLQAFQQTQKLFSELS